jgi:hypothetical protein
MPKGMKGGYGMGSGMKKMRNKNMTMDTSGKGKAGMKNAMMQPKKTQSKKMM